MSKPRPAPQPAAAPSIDTPDRHEDTIVHAPFPPAGKGRKAAIIGGALAGAALAGMLTRDAAGQRPDADPQERRQPQAGGRGTRALSIAPDSYDPDNHTVEAILSEGTAVQRYYFVEELEISAQAVDLTRVAAGVCPLLDTHNQYELDAQIGRIVDARIDGSQLIGTIQFDQTDAAQLIEARVARGELRAISIGYQVTTWQITSTPGSSDLETWRAMSWQLLEASFVPVPADPNAVVRSAPGISPHGTTEEDKDMRRNLPGGAAAAAPAASAAAPAAIVAAAAEPAARTEPSAPAHSPAPAAVEQRAQGVSASRILDLCGRDARLGGDFAADLIRANETAPLSEADLLGRVNERLLAAAPARIDARAASHRTDTASHRQAMEDAVMLRANAGITLPPVDGLTVEARIAAARDFRGMTLMELARHALDHEGVNTRGMNRLEIAGHALGLRYGAMVTTDFASALSNVANKRVALAYAAAPQTFAPLVTRDTLPDFKAVTIVNIGDAPALLVVPEGAEFKRGYITDSGLSYNLATYGRIIPITRQAIVNDDKGLFGEIPTMFGRKAADLESDLVWGTLLANPTMGDSYSLFDSAHHGNLAASGSAISVASVGAGEQAMLTQTNADGGYITISPKYLIVGPAKKVEAQQFLMPINATAVGAPNPYVDELTLIMDRRITGNQWFLAADPVAYKGLILAHLDGQDGLYLESRVGFDVDGVETKARQDVGAAIGDWRGWYKNPGN